MNSCKRTVFSHHYCSGKLHDKCVTDNITTSVYAAVK